MEKEIKTEYKMIKVNKELHKLLKIESVSSGKSMQNIGVEDGDSNMVFL
ncbi:hypothetical protein [Staphylococcus shinii]